MYSIYRIVNFANGKVYVGLSSNIKNRKCSHFTALKHRKHRNKHLQAAFNKFGRDSFYFEILESSIPSADTAKLREVYWISHFNSYRNGYNQTLGGDMIGYLWGKEVAWDGVKYNSISDCAAALGISASGLRSRLERGWVSSDQVPAYGHSRKKCVTWDGIEYTSITECAHALGISTATLLYRLKMGYTSTNQVKIPGKATAKKFIWNEIEYESMRECAADTGISESVLSRRRKIGIESSEQILHKNRRGKKVLMGGIEYISISEAARMLGVPLSTLTRRLEKQREQPIIDAALKAVRQVIERKYVSREDYEARKNNYGD